MKTRPYYGAFNARWIPPEDVAKTFVPVPQFAQLVHETHSVLLGPRGCGKTTLLKMLTRKALDQWTISGRNNRFSNQFTRPRYEAIYIPSDVRWSCELENLPETAGLSQQLSEQAQRILVTANGLHHLVGTLEELVHGEPSIESNICTGLIKRWKLIDTIPLIVDLRSKLDELVSEIRGELNIGRSERLKDVFNRIPASFYGHPLDAIGNAVTLITDHLPLAIRPPLWALCYDELEIAPKWLRTELLEALRSTTQNIFLKLTWSPLLPSGLRTSPESAADFKAIRLWNSHVTDPRPFCEDLTRDFLKERFPSRDIDPDSFFSRSILAAEKDDESPDSYEPDSTEYRIIQDLSKRDDSLRLLLLDRGIDPANPKPRSTQDKDQVLRKIKPIALLRSEFLGDAKMRTRKVVILYAGKEAVYAMSEGNPRWLLGLLNDFADIVSSENLQISYAEQAKLLNTFGQRFLANIKASPFKPPVTLKSRPEGEDITLYAFITRVGLFFQSEIYSRTFPLDPVGSFTVPEESDDLEVAVIEQLLEIGGLVYIGTSPQDIPISIRGSRFRLTFSLAPIFKLPLRNYRPVDLREATTNKENPEQLRWTF